MFQVSKKSQYGLRAVTYLAKAKKVASLKEVAKAEAIPFDFLEKILSKLEKAGLLNSKKGSQGGYCLARPLNKITAGSIVEALEGKIIPVECSFCGKAKKCVSKNVWDKVKQSLAKTLYSITIKDLVK